jgi:molybdopterin molybdotransferase
MAGDEIHDSQINSGETIKVMTGAFVPDAIEAVVPFENATLNSDGSVTLPEYKSGSNIRLKGEESNIGDILIKKGTNLTASHIGLIASQGKFVVRVSDRPRVAVISSGNEIIEPWQKAGEHQIYNSNASTLVALCKEQNCSVNYIQIVSDTYEATKDAVESLRGYDLIVSTGGISMGEADFMGKAFLECGLEPIFKNVNIKPGKPTTFGYMGECAVLALPGNPLSAIVNFYLFALPLIAKMQDSNALYPTFVPAKNIGGFKIKNARANVVLGSLLNGEFRAYNGYKYGSGMISPIANSNAFIVCGEGVDEVGDAQDVKVLVLNGQMSEKLVQFVL